MHLYYKVKWVVKDPVSPGTEASRDDFLEKGIFQLNLPPEADYNHLHM